MAIPIQNIYYLLCYAWNKLDERDRVAVSTEDCATLPDLFAKILINSTRILLRRGIDRNYVGVTAEIGGNAKLKCKVQNCLGNCGLIFVNCGLLVVRRSSFVVRGSLNFALCIDHCSLFIRLR